MAGDAFHNVPSTELGFLVGDPVRDSWLTPAPNPGPRQPHRHLPKAT